MSEEIHVEKIYDINEASQTMPNTSVKLENKS